jgi:folate-binding protein YgfZ
MPSVALENRGVLKVAGAEARSFLQGLFTCDMDKVTPERPGFGALLNPQGKIIVDFLLHDSGDTFLIDCPQALAADLLKRLRLYRLRAKLEIEDVSLQWTSGAAWDAAPLPAEAIGGPDPRSAALGLRFLAPVGTVLPAGRDDYDARRIAAGVPEGGIDFPYGDTFPHEADMDLLHGVDFRKGCYVGQEVVSRVEHRGTARKRIVKVTYAGQAPAPGTSILMNEVEIGTTGSANGIVGLALLRLDRAEDAKVAGIPLMAGITALASIGTLAKT